MLNLRLILEDLDPTGDLTLHFHEAKMVSFYDVHYWMGDCENIKKGVIREAKLLFRALEQNGYLIKIGKGRQARHKKSAKFIKFLEEMVE